MFTYCIDPDIGLLMIRCEGSVTDRALLDFYTGLYTDPAWRPDMDEFADYSRADGVRVSMSGIRTLARMAMEQEGAKRTAAVVSGKLNWGLSRVFTSLVDRSQEEIRLFLDPVKALEWLGHTPEVLEGRMWRQVEPSESVPVE